MFLFTKMYEQLQSPNLDPVVFENGRALTDWYGWCLATVETAFDTPREYPNAWAAWGATQYRHEDRNFPTEVYFPIWFSGYGGEGHVAFAYVNGNGDMGIWTSPYEHIPYFYTGYHTVDALANGYHVSYVGWSEDLAGLRLVQPKPQPVPTPSTPLYTITPIASKQIVLNKQPTKEWNLGLSTLAEIEAQPFSSGSLGDIKTVVAELRTTVAGITDCVYYLENSGSPVGWNSVDCNDYSPPAPVAPHQPPSAPLPVPVATTDLMLDYSVPYYPSATNAMEGTKIAGTYTVGKYLVFQTALNGSKQISKTTDGLRYWINPADNAAKQIVNTSADIQKTFTWLFPTHEPVEYRIVKPYLVRDMVHTGRSIQIDVGHNIEIYGWFVVNGVKYLRPFTPGDLENRYYYYGIPTQDIYTGFPYLENEFNIEDKIQYGWERFYDKAIKTIEGIFRLRKGNK